MGKGIGIAACACAAAVAAAAAGPARAAAPTHPVIVSVVASPHLLARGGGAVTVRVRVRAARSCRFEGQRFAAGPYAPGRTLSCAAGRVSVRLPVGANPYAARSTIHFRVTASDRAGHAAVRAFSVAQAPMPAPKPAPDPPPPLAVETDGVPVGVVGAAYAVTLAAGGGKDPYTWTAPDGSLPPGLTLASTGAIAGTPTVAGRWQVAVTVVDAAGATVTAALTFTIAAPAAAPPTPPDVPTMTSSNWSGYILLGGPYTGVAGTFTVPTIGPGPVIASTSEWVGIDGTSSTNPGIVQAGVAEDYLPSTSTYRVYAWVELFPLPAQAIPLVVAPGNTITVTILQAGAGLWTVQVKDATTGESWTENEPYAGPASSAEWVVEAPSNSSGILPLASYTPVTFTQLGIDPAAGDLGRVVMIQKGVTVSTPSPLSANGFTVAYGNVTPAAP